jgi:hypothetical protein
VSWIKRNDRSAYNNKVFYFFNPASALLRSEVAVFLNVKEPRGATRAPKAYLNWEVLDSFTGSANPSVNRVSPNGNSEVGIGRMLGPGFSLVIDAITKYSGIAP